MKEKNRAAFLQIPLFRDEEGKTIFDVHDATTTDPVPKRAWVRQLKEKGDALLGNDDEENSGEDIGDADAATASTAAVTTSRRKASRAASGGRKKKPSAPGHTDKKPNVKAGGAVGGRKRQRDSMSGGEEKGRGQRRKRNPVGGGGAASVDEYGYLRTWTFRVPWALLNLDLEPNVPPRREKPGYYDVPEVRQCPQACTGQTLTDM